MIYTWPGVQQSGKIYRKAENVLIAKPIIRIQLQFITIIGVHSGPSQHNNISQKISKQPWLIFSFICIFVAGKFIWLQASRDTGPGEHQEWFGTRQCTQKEFCPNLRQSYVVHRCVTPLYRIPMGIFNCVVYKPGAFLYITTVTVASILTSHCRH